ncbi:MAG: SDR family NAD(P)-dependent oxidoreductase [Fodinibius sp.]|nr:SDR family NAD(P)-dependent oxidoreductase [Fodinibius sp.]
MHSDWNDKRVLITGVSGTVGKELLRQVITKDPKEILGIDNNESELFFITDEFKEYDNVNLMMCDIRDKDRVRAMTRGIDIILHAAALKHVILCEEAPWEPIRTNIDGTQNIVDAAIENGVERVLFTSSDKAVNPTNVMGTSKLMGERLMTAANSHKRGDGPIFASTRFGNVMGSRGSVIPIFEGQIKEGGPVTLTDRRMSRFIMTLEQAVKLVMDSVFLAKGGEVFVTKMPIIKIETLAEAMVEVLAPRCGYKVSDVDITIIGSKPGEKLYEELINDEETRRTIELPQYFAVIPAFQIGI